LETNNLRRNRSNLHKIHGLRHRTSANFQIQKYSWVGVGFYCWEWDFLNLGKIRKRTWDGIQRRSCEPCTFLKKNQKENNGVPKIIWALLAFFAYDDLLPLLGSWFIYYPLCIFIALIAFFFAIGNLWCKIKFLLSIKFEYLISF